jgi:hypothetical protein
VNLHDARSRVSQLHRDLKEIAANNPNQEVRGFAVPVIDAVVTVCAPFLDEEDPVFEKIQQLFSVEAMEAGKPLRAVDAQIAAGQLLQALPPEAPLVG